MPGPRPGRYLAAVRGLKEGDDEGWYLGWYNMAQRVENRANRVKDKISQGKALLRAANYYRTAEFFLRPGDSRRLHAFDKSVETFYRALDDLGVRYEVLTVPYEGHTLKAVFYRALGGESKPLLVAHGGYDSTQEELYFLIVAAALERGYSCLTFAGPGQGSAIRKQGLMFTPEWKNPPAPSLTPLSKNTADRQKLCRWELALGVILRPGLAAHDHRIDGVVAHNVCYNLQEAAFRQVPRPVIWLYDRGYFGLVNWMMRIAMKFKPGMRWGVLSGEKWTMGAKDPIDVLRIFDQYDLKNEAGLITCDVLITAGEKDHLFPVEQVEAFRKALTKAKSVTIRIFSEAEGGAEHCQMGALNMFHETLFDWIESRFPAEH